MTDKLYQPLCVMIALCMFFPLAACAVPAATVPGVDATTASSDAPLDAQSPESEMEGWTLVWQDEFDGDVLDRLKWTFDIGGNGWGNNEDQYYTARSQNVRLENGFLVIEAQREEYGQKPFTSARLKTQGINAWTYGRFEARMKIPAGQGIWPAFWLLGEDIPQNGWPTCGEIDIMENIGREPRTLHASLHAQGFSGGNSMTGSIVNDTALAEDFHVYAVEWETDQIRWYLDEVQYFSVDREETPGEWVFDHPFFIILNLAIGGNWPGRANENTSFPSQLVVDYVRVYQ